jgi:hypothetical protein
MIYDIFNMIKKQYAFKSNHSKKIKVRLFIIYILNEWSIISEWFKQRRWFII